MKGNQSLQAPGSANPRRDDFIKQYSITGDFDKSFYNSDAYYAFQKDRLSRSLIGRIYRKMRRLLEL